MAQSSYGANPFGINPFAEPSRDEKEPSLAGNDAFGINPFAAPQEPEAPKGNPYQIGYAAIPTPEQATEPDGFFASAGKGFAHGLTQIAGSVGTGLEYLGTRTGSEELNLLGQSVSGYWEKEGKDFAKDQRLEGSVVDDPSLLYGVLMGDGRSASWWAYHVAEMVPSLAAAIIPGVAAGKYISVAGNAMRLTPETITQLARYGGAIAGGTVGGALEGTGAYEEALKRGASPEQAAQAMELMTLASAGLNALALDKILRLNGDKGILYNFLTRGATESITEWAEEPTQEMIVQGVTTDDGSFNWSKVGQAAKEGVNVMGPAFLLGGGMSVIAGKDAQENPNVPPPPNADQVVGADPNSQPPPPPSQAIPTDLTDPNTYTFATEMPEIQLPVASPDGGRLFVTDTDTVSDEDLVRAFASLDDILKTPNLPPQVYMESENLRDQILDELQARQLDPVTLQERAAQEDAAWAMHDFMAQRAAEQERARLDARADVDLLKRERVEEWEKRQDETQAIHDQAMQEPGLDYLASVLRRNVEEQGETYDEAQQRGVEQEIMQQQPPANTALADALRAAGQERAQPEVQDRRAALVEEFVNLAMPGEGLAKVRAERIASGMPSFSDEALEQRIDEMRRRQARDAGTPIPVERRAWDRERLTEEGIRHETLPPEIVDTLLRDMTAAEQKLAAQGIKEGEPAPGQDRPTSLALEIAANGTMEGKSVPVAQQVKAIMDLAEETFVPLTSFDFPIKNDSILTKDDQQGTEVSQVAQLLYDNELIDRKPGHHTIKGHSGDVAIDITPVTDTQADGFQYLTLTAGNNTATLLLSPAGTLHTTPSSEKETLQRIIEDAQRAKPVTSGTRDILQQIADGEEIADGYTVADMRDAAKRLGLTYSGMKSSDLRNKIEDVRRAAVEIGKIDWGKVGKAKMMALAKRAGISGASKLKKEELASDLMKWADGINDIAGSISGVMVASEKAKAARTLPEMDPTKDSVVELLAKAGGLNRESFGGELYRIGNPRVGLHHLVRRNGGMTKGEAAELLWQLGFDVKDGESYDDHRVIELLEAEVIGGKKQYSHTHADIDSLMEDQAREYYEAQEAEYQERLAELNRRIEAGENPWDVREELGLPSDGEFILDDEKDVSNDAERAELQRLAALASRIDPDAVEVILESLGSDADVIDQLREIVNGRQGQDDSGVDASAQGGRDVAAKNPVQAQGKGDLFGEDTSTAQALHDRKLELDRQRNGTRDVPPGEKGGLFSDENKQTDIEDVGSADELLEGVDHFHSGSSSIADLLGVMEAGQPVGVTASVLTKNGINQIAQSVLDWYRAGAPEDAAPKIFVDSGAFSGGEGYMDRAYQVYNDLLDALVETWEEVLTDEAFGNEITEPMLVQFVLPDVVGDLSATIDIAKRYSEQSQSLLDRLHSLESQYNVTGSSGPTFKLIMPWQGSPKKGGGALPLRDSTREDLLALMEAHFGDDRSYGTVLIGIPMFKSPPTKAQMEAIRDAISDLQEDSYAPFPFVGGVHLLGISPKRGKAYGEALAVFRGVGSVTSDSATVASQARTGGEFKQRFDANKEDASARQDDEGQYDITEILGDLAQGNLPMELPVFSDFLEKAGESLAFPEAMKLYKSYTGKTDPDLWDQWWEDHMGDPRVEAAAREKFGNMSPPAKKEAGSKARTKTVKERLSKPARETKKQQEADKQDAVIEQAEKVLGTPYRMRLPVKSTWGKRLNEARKANRAKLVAIAKSLGIKAGGKDMPTLLELIEVGLLKEMQAALEQTGTPASVFVTEDDSSGTPIYTVEIQKPEGVSLELARRMVDRVKARMSQLGFTQTGTTRDPNALRALIGAITGEEQQYIPEDGFYQGRTIPLSLSEEMAEQGRLKAEGGVEQAAPTEQAATQEEPAPSESRGQEYGSQNTLVSKERAEELRKQLQEKLGRGGTLNSGIDPTIVALGAELAVFHIEAGARKFSDFAKAMIHDLGESARPYLKFWYNAVRDWPGMEAKTKDMDTRETVKSTDVSTITGAAPAAPQQTRAQAGSSPRSTEASSARRNTGTPAQGEERKPPASTSNPVLEKHGVKVEQKTARNGKDVWEIKGWPMARNPMLKDAFYDEESGRSEVSWYQSGQAWTLWGHANEDIPGTLAKLLETDLQDAKKHPSKKEIAARKALRERLDTTGEDLSTVDTDAYVQQETKALLDRGLKHGIPQEVLNDQAEDAAKMVRGYDKGLPMFLLASAAGSGKTFVLGAAIREMKRLGAKRFVYFTMNQGLIDQIKRDLADYGIVADIDFHTYAEISTNPEAVNSRGAVVLADEAHNLKNPQSNRGYVGGRVFRDADYVVLASATPFENPVQAAFLEPTGVFDEVEGHVNWAKAYGAIVRRFGDRETLAWDRGRIEDGRAAREWMIKRGLFTFRPLRLPPNMVDSFFHKADVPHDMAELYIKVDHAYQLAMDAAPDQAVNIQQHRANTLKRILEAAKMPEAIRRARKYLEDGKNVVVFVESKSERHLGRYRRSGAKQKDQLYTPAEIREQMAEWEQSVRWARMMGDTIPKPPFAPFVAEIAYAFEEVGIDQALGSTQDIFKQEFGAGLAVFTGDVPTKKRGQEKDAFLSGEKKIIMATMAAGGTGLSLHDTVGNRPTVQIGLNLPWVATGVDQVSARTARYGLKSRATIEWLFASNIPFEAETLAPRVGARMRDMGAIVKGVTMPTAETLDGGFDFEGSVDVSAAVLKETTKPPRQPKAPGVVNRDARDLQSALEALLGEKLPAGTIVVAKPTTKGARAARALAKLFGKEVIFFNNRRPDLVNLSGAVVPGRPGVIFISAQSRHAFRRVLGHELTHWMRRERPDLYDHLAQVAREELAPNDQYKNLSEEAMEELVADFVGDQFGSKLFLDLVAGRSPSSFGRIAQAIIDFFDNALTMMLGGDLESSSHFQDTVRMRETAAEALQAWVDNRAANWEKQAAREQTKSAIGNQGTFDPKNPSILLRQGGDPWYRQPVDRVFRLPLELFGLLDNRKRVNFSRRGLKWIVNQIEHAQVPARVPYSAALNNGMNAARAGLIDRWGQTEEYMARSFKARADKRQILAKARGLLDQMEKAGVGKQEAELIQSILVGELPTQAQWAAVTDPVRNAIIELGLEAVDLGLISQESFDRNYGEYLHRVYLQYEKERGGLTSWLMKRRMKIIGEEAKLRGINAEVTLDRINRDGKTNYPDTAQVKGKFFDMWDKIDPATGKATDRKWLPAGSPQPQGYTHKGRWEARWVQKKKITLYRDYTKAERVTMGEVIDARYTIAKTFQLLAHDISSARHFKDIAAHPDWTYQGQGVPPNATPAGGVNATYAGFDWVQVPSSIISKTGGVQQWGALAGKYVKPEVFRDLSEVQRMMNPNFWRKALTQWKLNKTARNPVVHMNNVMSNMLFMDLADVRWGDLYNAINSFIKKDQHYQDALDHGAFGGGMVDVEFRQELLDPILKELVANMQSNTSPLQNPGALSKLRLVLEKIGQGIKTVDDAMRDAYQIEDQIFRLATYMREIEAGVSKEEAAQHAVSQFLDYEIRAPWINTLRNTVLPFISYTYRAVPVLMRSMAERPWKLAKYIIIGHVFSALAYSLSGGDEEEERRSMPDEISGDTIFFFPRMFRMPWNDKHDNPVYLDVRRWIPAGDIFDTNQGQIGLPAPLQFGGPMLLAFESILNKQAFTGDEIWNPLTDTKGESVSKWAGFMWRSWMPSHALIPGSWYQDKLIRSHMGAQDRLGRTYDPGYAWASSFGLKFRQHDVQYGKMQHAFNIRSAQTDLEHQLRTLADRHARGLISTPAYQKEKENIARKFRTLGEEAQERLGNNKK